MPQKPQIRIAHMAGDLHFTKDEMPTGSLDVGITKESVEKIKAAFEQFYQSEINAEAAIDKTITAAIPEDIRKNYGIILVLPKGALQIA